MKAETKLHWIKSISYANWIGIYWTTTATGLRVWVRQHLVRETWQIHTGDGAKWGAFNSADAAMRAAEVGVA
jgi:hypothetical protein